MSMVSGRLQQICALIGDHDSFLKQIKRKNLEWFPFVVRANLSVQWDPQRKKWDPLVNWQMTPGQGSLSMPFPSRQASAKVELLLYVCVVLHSTTLED